MTRPLAADFLSLFFGFEKGNTRWSSSRVPGGKVGNRVVVFHFSRRRTPGGGNVKISPGLRDFQGAVGSVGNLGLVFHAFHHPGISTAPRSRYPNAGGSGTCILHCRSSRDLAACILRAHSVSLISKAWRSNSAQLSPGLSNRSTPSSDFNFSKGVR
jgi:hypothetical protein